LIEARYLILVVTMSRPREWWLEAFQVCARVESPWTDRAATPARFPAVVAHYSPTPPRHQTSRRHTLGRPFTGRTGTSKPDIGHFFLVLDPAVFRHDAGFIADIDAMIDFLHATPPIDSERPVLVPGELVAEIEAICRRHAVPFVLDSGTAPLNVPAPPITPESDR
jgi:Malate/L-lactate dehydrogenase